MTCDMTLPPKTCEKSVQTTIRVFPHILNPTRLKAHIICENRSQTQITLRSSEDNKAIYPMLEYIPFQDIQEQNVRVVNLPRQLKLHFTSESKIVLDKCLFDDDGVNELCIELKERRMCCPRKPTKVYKDQCAQTSE